MSDSEQPEQTIPKKAKRQLTPEQLEKLAAAREKANAVRKEKAAAKKKEKELANLKAKQRQNEVEAEIATLQKPKASMKPKTPPKRAAKKPNVYAEIEDVDDSSEEEDSESDYSTEESSSSEEEIEYRPPPKKKNKYKKKKKQVRYAEPANPMDDVYQQRMQQAFGSLFPNY
jgi:hypothetical protein